MSAPSRSDALGQRLAALLPDRPRLLFAEPPDEAALTWLAARLARPQRWLIADPDPARIDAVFERVAQWADRNRLTSTLPNRALLIHAPGGAWRIEGTEADPADLMEHEFVDAVIADRPAADAAIWRAYRTPHDRPPLLACLCATGRDTWMPRLPGDRLLRPLAAQVTNPDATIRQLRAQGCDVASAVSDWRVPATALATVRALVEEAAGDAHHKAIRGWRQARLKQTLAARLAVKLGYRDILARPQ